MGNVLILMASAYLADGQIDQASALLIPPLLPRLRPTF